MLEETETVRSEMSRGAWDSRRKCPESYTPASTDPTAGHLEAITGIIYKRSEVTRQKCRCRDSGGAGERARKERERVSRDLGLASTPSWLCVRTAQRVQTIKPH